jgi:hypothetical protein
MEGNTKEIGKWMSDKEEVLRDILMAILIMGNSEWEKLMEKVFINGIMERYMMENGIMD